MARVRPALDGRVPDVRLTEPVDDRPRAPERPLPRVRRPDGLHPGRDGGGRAVARRLAGRSGETRRAARPAPSGRPPEANDTNRPIGRGGSDPGCRRGRRACRASISRTCPRPSIRTAASPAPTGRRHASSRRAVDELTLRSLPDFKSTEAYGYPLIRAGASVTVDAGSGPVAQEAGTLVIICDALYATAIGAPCGGPAEAVVAPPARFGEPIDRFEAAPGRTISVYRAGS